MLCVAVHKLTAIARVQLHVLLGCDHGLELVEVWQGEPP